MKVTKRKAIALIMVAAIILMIYGVGAWRPKCRYIFEGVWVFDQPASDEVVVVSISPVDITGKRESGAIGMIINTDPAGYGGAQWSDCHMKMVSTGKDTFECRGICYLLDAAEKEVLILLMGGTGTWIDEDHIGFEFFSKIYTAAQDSDLDGLPDEGQAPFLVNTWSYNAERLSWFPAPA